VRLFAVLVENVSGSQPGSRKEPDQHSSTISLWIAHCRPTSVMRPRAINAKSNRGVIRLRFW
jgi:hypothetical protein